MTTVKPIAGPMFRQAAALPVNGTKRRKLLCLLAAYSDAGEQSPTVKQLAKATGFVVPQIDQLLRLLQADGWIRVRWRASNHRPRPRNVYTLNFNGKGGRR